MNKQVAQILQLGIIFTVIVGFLDVLLTQVPVLDWLVLGVTFFFVAAAIIDSVARLVPRENHRLASNHVEEDELQHLAEVIDRAANRRENEALGILFGRLRSIALGTVAARTRLSKKEVMELVQNNPNSLLAIVKDEKIVRLLSGRAQMFEAVNHQQVEEFLSRIESWSR